MQNQFQKILHAMDPTHTLFFTSRQVSNWASNKNNLPFIQSLASTADYPFYQHNYCASLLHNYATKPKVPKIFKHIPKKGSITYSLKPHN